MSNPDGMPSLFSPEQAQAIRDAIAGFGEALAAIGAWVAKTRPSETPALPEEETISGP